MNNFKYDDKVQFIIVGDSTVGKTSILKSFFESEFKSTYLATVGVDFYTKDIEISNKIIRVKVWDTAGQERYKSLSNNYFKNAQGIILVFDLNNRDTFNSLKEWLISIHDNVGKDSNVQIVVLGNKVDLKREVDKSEGEEFCNLHGKDFKYFETSAKNGLNIQESFNYLITSTLKSLNKIRESDINVFGKKNVNKDNLIDINNPNSSNNSDNSGGCRC